MFVRARRNGKNRIAPGLLAASTEGTTAAPPTTTASTTATTVSSIVGIGAVTGDMAHLAAAVAFRRAVASSRIASTSIVVGTRIGAIPGLLPEH